MVTQDGNLYKCESCGFHYKNRIQAQKCAAWCDKYKSCNVEITASAIENKKHDM